VFCVENGIAYEVDDAGEEELGMNPRRETTTVREETSVSPGLAAAASPTIYPSTIIAQGASPTRKAPPPVPPKKDSSSAALNTPGIGKTTQKIQKPSQSSSQSSNGPQIVTLEDLLNDDEDDEQQDNPELAQHAPVSPLDALEAPFKVNVLREKLATPHMNMTDSPSMRKLPLDDTAHFTSLQRLPQLSDADRHTLAYENIILTTGILRFLNAEDLSCVLSTIRTMLHITQDQHTEILSNLLLEGMTPHISTSVNPSIHEKITTHDNLPKIFWKTGSLWYRLRLVREMENENARRRHQWIALNALILAFRNEEKGQSFCFEPPSEVEAEKVIISDEHEFASVVSACLEAFVTNTTSAQDDIVFNALLEWTMDLRENYPFPLNLQCYTPLVRLAAQSLLEVDSDEDDFDDEDDADMECQEIISALKKTRESLDIDEICGDVAFLASLCKQFSSAPHQEDQTVITSHIRSTLHKIEEDAPFNASSGNARLQQEKLFSQCFDSFGSKLMNYTQVYGEHEVLLKEHLQIFSALIRLSNVILNGTAGDTEAQMSRASRYILRGTAIHNYQLAKGTLPITKDIVAMLDFEKHLYEEMQEEHEAIGQIFEELSEHCHIDYDTVMFSLLSADVAQLLEYIGELSPDVFHLFSVLGDNWISHICRELNSGQESTSATNNGIYGDEEGRPSPVDVFVDGEELANIEILFQPLIVATRPLLDGWLDKIKILFQEYLDNCIRLENWKPVSEEIHYSSSAVDVIGFLDRSIPFLKQIHLPIMKSYYRHYVQTCCGMVQKYCAIMVDPIPPCDKLMPFLPPFKKVKNNTLFSKKSKNKVTPEEEKYLRAEAKRLRYGKQFNRERLFIRLNNITFVRQRLLKLLERMDNDWVDTVDTLFHGKMVSKEVDFAVLARGTCELIKTLIQQLIDFIAYSNVYIHLWEEVFIEQPQRLYFESAQDTSLQSLLPKYFDALLGTIVENVEEESLSEVIIRATFKCVIHSLEIVLLDGGEHRIFFVEDHKLVLRDLGALESYFFQDGNGISSQAFLLHCTARLKGIAGTLMDKSTEDLINGGDFNQSFHELPDRSQDSPYTKELVYKVLYHRKSHDKMAKKFLSKVPFVWG